MAKIRKVVFGSLHGPWMSSTKVIQLLSDVDKAAAKELQIPLGLVVDMVDDVLCVVGSNLPMGMETRGEVEWVVGHVMSRIQSYSQKISATLARGEKFPNPPDWMLEPISRPRRRIKHHKFVFRPTLVLSEE